MRDKEGLIREDLLRLEEELDQYGPFLQNLGVAHSEGAGCLGGSIGESCIVSSIEIDVTSSVGDINGIGSTWAVTMKGAL